MASIIESIETKVNEIIVGQGLTLYDIEYIKEGKNYYLKIYIERENQNGIDIEDCVLISKLVNDYLDNNDAIIEEHILEVSSPGIIRKLKKEKHFVKQIGNEILISTYTKIDGFESKVIKGILEEVEKEGIIINKKKILFSQITKAETVFEF